MSDSQDQGEVDVSNQDDSSQVDALQLLQPSHQQEFNANKLNQIESKLPNALARDDMLFLLKSKSDFVRVVAASGKTGKVSIVYINKQNNYIFLLFLGLGTF